MIMLALALPTTLSTAALPAAP
eukprot:COSAG02_NODE_14570_length_1258_cov_20.179465_1_plen_21_part_01